MKAKRLSLWVIAVVAVALSLLFFIITNGEIGEIKKELSSHDSMVAQVTKEIKQIESSNDSMVAQVTKEIKQIESSNDSMVAQVTKELRELGKKLSKVEKLKSPKSVKQGDGDDLVFDSSMIE
jgi:F0F1-type ATP synthase membrane subunit b/b'